MNAQDLNTHQWKHRLVLIISSEIGSDILMKQLEAFKPFNTEFRTRKLIVYEILPQKFKVHNSQIIPWTLSDKLYKMYNKTMEDFKVILIGLDGRIKLEMDTILSKSQLFKIIDAMPMRQSEIRNY